MAVLSLKYLPDPVLRRVAKEVAAFDDDLRRLVADMRDTMHANEGIGLAAPQVGVELRVVVVDLGERDDSAPNRDLSLVNPKITFRADTMVEAQEGCLSIPGEFADVSRPAEVEVEYQNLEGTPCTVRAQGLLGACLQHEIDHLNGVLFVDHLSRLRREVIVRRFLRGVRERQDKRSSRSRAPKTNGGTDTATGV